MLNHVHNKGGAREINTIVTSKEAILTACRELAAETGLQALNMRAVAQKCHVSVGSVYNYFPSKADLVAATIQHIWRNIFHMDTASQKPTSFPDYVTWIFQSVQAGVMEYPNFFAAHSMSFASTEKGKARQVMEGYFSHMKAGLLDALQQDSLISPAAFSDDFAKSDFVDFVFSSLLSLLVSQKSSCAMLREIIARTIYTP